MAISTMPGAADRGILRERLATPASRSRAPTSATNSCCRALRSRRRAYGFDARNVTPDRWLNEGDSVALGAHRFDVLHCPGHTPGHVVFINHAARFALVGDVLFQGSVGRTDFPYGDHAALIHAIKQKLLPLGDDYQFLCGHGPGSTIGDERQGNPFLR